MPDRPVIRCTVARAAPKERGDWCYSRAVRLRTVLPWIRRNARAALGVAIVGLVSVGAALAPLLDVHDPFQKDLLRGATDLGEPLPPSARYSLGTDTLGRCVSARLLHGARLSLAIGVGATALAIAVGLLVGLLAGYGGPRADAVLMRGMDVLLAFPFLLLVIALAASKGNGGNDSAPVLLVLGLAGWPRIARTIRTRVLVLRELDYVHAARALGAGPVRVLLQHVLWNLGGPVAILAALLVPQMILAEATLSYLGLGPPPPIPSWGRMLAEGQPLLRGAPWLVVVPGAAIALTALGFNLLGEGLRDALDPKAGR